MDLEGIMLSEISQTERHILCDITYIWNLENITTEYNQREAENHRTSGCWWGGAEGRYKTGAVGGTNYWV